MIYLACAVLLSPSDRRCCRGCCKPATAKDRGGLFVWILLQLIGYMLAAAVLGCRWTQSVTTGAKKGVNQEVGQTVCWGLSAAQRRAQSDVGGWLFFYNFIYFFKGWLEVSSNLPVFSYAGAGHAPLGGNCLPPEPRPREGQEKMAQMAFVTKSAAF